MNRNSSDMKSKRNNRVHGAAMVEFAIVLPLLIILLFGFTELGRMLYQQNQLTKQVGAGARYLARVPGAIEIDNDCAEGNSWESGVTRAERWIREDEDGNLMLDNVALAFTRTTGNGGACIIRVEATAPFDAIFGDSIVPLLNLGPITMNATVEERYIGA